jgi:hypothetical protein
VLIDCPPSLGLLTVNGPGSRHEVVVPIQCEYYALEGVGQLLRNVSLVQRNLNPTLEVSAFILVMYDARTKLSEQVVLEVRKHFGDKVCRHIVPRTVRLSEAPSFGQPIIAFDPSSRGRSPIGSWPRRSVVARRSGLGRGLGALIPADAAPVVSQLREVPTSSLLPNPNQPRRHFDEDSLGALAASVRELGVLQPVLVRVLETGAYELIAGERRWRAATRAGPRHRPGPRARRRRDRLARGGHRGEPPP